jgi:hypothetical protein
MATTFNANIVFNPALPNGALVINNCTSESDFKTRAVAALEAQKSTAQGNVDKIQAAEDAMNS